MHFTEAIHLLVNPYYHVNAEDLVALGLGLQFFSQSMFNYHINKSIVLKKICSLCHAPSFHYKNFH